MKIKKGDVLIAKATIAVPYKLTKGKEYVAQSGDEKGHVRMIDDDGIRWYPYTDRFIHKEDAVAFSKELVTTVVMSNNDTSRTEAQKREWLNSVGITDTEIDKIITPPLVSYDIVKRKVAG